MAVAFSSGVITLRLPFLTLYHSMVGFFPSYLLRLTHSSKITESQCHTFEESRILLMIMCQRRFKTDPLFGYLAGIKLTHPDI